MWCVAVLTNVSNAYADRNYTSDPDPLCGPKSLLGICEIYDIDASLQELCRLSGYNQTSGTTMYGLYTAAGKKGLAPVALKTTLERLSDGGLPCIAFVDGNHFTVIHKIFGDDVLIQDYTDIPFLETKLDFLSRWNGEILTFSGKRSAKPVTTAGKENAGTDGARIWFDKRFHAFAEADEGDTLRYRYTFRNTGTEALVVRSRSTCTCAVASIGKSVIPPDGEGSIDVVLDTHEKTGKIKQHIYVQTNDSEHKMVKLTLAVNVKEAVKVVPEKIWFDEVVAGETVIKKLTLSKPANTPLRVSLDLPDTITGSIVRSDSGTADTMTITLSIAPHDVGDYAASVTLLTDDPKTQRIDIPVAGRVAPAMKVFPPKVFFGEVSVNSTSTKTATITTDIPGKLYTKTDSHYFTADITPISGNNHLLTVNLKTPGSGMSIRDHVAVYSEGDKRLAVEIPLYALVSEND